MPNTIDKASRFLILIYFMEGDENELNGSEIKPWTHLKNPLFDVSVIKDLRLTYRRLLAVVVLLEISQATVLKEMFKMLKVKTNFKNKISLQAFNSLKKL